MYFSFILIAFIGQSLATDNQPIETADQTVRSGQQVVSEPIHVNEPEERNNKNQISVIPSHVLHCGANEVISDCLTPCQPTCEFPNQLPCPEFSARSNSPQEVHSIQPISHSKPTHIPPPPCFPGCVCAPGFVRDDLGACIARRHCPHICKLHSHFEKCGPRCQTTCDVAEPRASTICIQHMDVCVTGCFCDAGYVKDLKTGHCVRPHDCSQVCPENEHYSNYGNPCAPTCQKPIVDTYCKNQTIVSKGCYCNQGFLRDIITKKCIRKHDCPPHTCGVGEQWYGCKPCTPTCADVHHKCTHICHTGCDCKRGLVRDQRSGKCVPLCECPQFHHPFKH